MARPTISKKTETVSDFWKISSDNGLSWRCWDGEYVVFNPASGNTHLLDIASGQVLMTLVAEPTETSRIQEQLAGFLEVDRDDRLVAAVSEILTRLEGLELIEPAKRCS